ncbi:patatin-like phospholipase family protein [Clostridium beijerinckii]|uniref:patatin-like phospholipase family protein n=1 Tax=Clostridium beijerinckii TaxID=1520 RepID=UPI00242B1A49|nr:patatin-like phospholipase family protein [Clostridium beijerinckii]MDG5852443.1 patatin-like phospholipase family protein [Clostridium beijerinckii]
MEYNFRNLVFEGGGVKGIAYLGALEILEQKGILRNIKRVGGTSAGAIIALMVGLGYSKEELYNTFNEMNLRSFMDDDIGSIRDLYRLLIKGYGWFKGEAFTRWLENIIEKKTGNKDSTFKEIKDSGKFKEMFFQGTNLTKHEVETFSAENEKYEDMPIKDAVRISMSIPLFFESVKMNNCCYVDGGILSNYPVRLFDRKIYVEEDENYFIPEEYEKMLHDKVGNTYVYNKETLGFRLDSKNKIDLFNGRTQPNDHTINSFFSYSWNLISTLMENQDITHLTGDDFDRTIYIDSMDVSTTDFEIDYETKMKLIDSGRIGTIEYFEEYDKGGLKNYSN